ncbi:hypothetical protein ACIOJD_10590 [Streptomyces sp. NPDC088116]|uniref:hypothetical protein n=1 Tax=Streptomyces sp. NPDC088116 TaxID=3365825 RepID=UPI00382C65F8
MGALTRTELLIELLAQLPRLAAAVGPEGTLGVLLCVLLVRAARAARVARDDGDLTVNLLCAASVLLVLLLVASG